MSENLRMYHAAAYGLSAVVHRVPGEQWDTPSMCAEWTCREVIGHVTWLAHALADALGTGQALPETPEAEVAGVDPAASWSVAFRSVLEGLDRPGALHRTIPGPFGDMRVDDRIRITALDNYTHTWDIAHALGLDPHLDPEVARIALPGFLEAADNIRAPGLLGPAVDIAPSASDIDRLLAASGRNPAAPPLT